MEYNANQIEQRWQQYWRDNKTYKVEIDPSKPKYYVLDMFPYPSGSGLHVGHPLGYIASDIYARYKKHQGFNVLHPMGYDAYGLPAEQYAIQTGTHPAITTEKNIARYREQMDRIGFCYDWDREIKTCDPKYYKWTQWTFIQLFHSYYCNQAQQARPITELIEVFSQQGNQGLDLACTEPMNFTANEWLSKTEQEQQQILMNYRLAFISETMVNWCPKLGTVLANDEVKDGVSERGGYPVERKKMKQWSLRISAYAQRLLDDLEKLEWSESLKEVQRNWIGRSEGAAVFFTVKDKNIPLEVFTTRPDTLFGATFMVLAPEHDLVMEIVSKGQREAVENYLSFAKNRSDRDRMTEVKKTTGVFTGAYAINPITGKELPIWISDYVLMGYGSGAIMAVPAHDSRDFAFAKNFQLPIIQVVAKEGEPVSNPETWSESYDAKEGIMINSELLNGMSVKEAIKKIIHHIQEHQWGYGTVNYRLRDAIFSRQRYWGEPFPIYYRDGMPFALPESELPLLLPEIDTYLPTENGEPPLARAKNWTTKEGYPLETNTMPGFAGSSGYYLRYQDPHNTEAYFSKEANNYWQNVDLYLGGDEHATGHLIYARFWNKFLFDLGMTCNDEPFKKLINQGKIQGRSNFVFRINGTNTFVSKGLQSQYETTRLHVDISLVDNDYLDIEAFKQWRTEYNDADFILEGGKYLCDWEVEKMSKSKYNVQNPDDLIDKYGADTFRLYEMFLGPLESSKPWDTNGIEGTARFIKKFWRLYHNNPDNQFFVSNEAPTKSELKILHRTIKKVIDDIERFSLNTIVSHFMIAVNDLQDLKCNKRDILEPLVVLISPYTPHISEELWSLLGHQETVTVAPYPTYDEKFLVDDEIEYPVSINGKMRFKLMMPADADVATIEKAVINNEATHKWLNGSQITKVIVVPKKIVNVVAKIEK